MFVGNYIDFLQSYIQLGQTKRSQPVVPGFHPNIAWGFNPVHCTLDSREARVNFTFTYPQADQSAAWNLETTNHSPHTG